MISKFFYLLGDYLVERVPNSVRHIGYFRELNSYPAFAILRPDSADYQSTVTHFADGSRLVILRCMLRCYTHTSIETAMDDVETLGRTIENLVQSFSAWSAARILIDAGVLTTQEAETLLAQDDGGFSLFNLCIQERFQYIEDARVLSVETDEGLYAPYGICDLEVEMFYVEEK